jgi:DNA-binding NarL/FixJ family response regulator
MKTTRATSILSSLVQGIDPKSGEELAANSVLQDAEVLRALLAGIAALKEQAARETRRRGRPANVGNAWTTEEEQRLTGGFHAGETITALAEALGRTTRAVEARLERLGLIAQEQRGAGAPLIQKE